MATNPTADERREVSVSVVLPFYLYAGLSFFAGTILLFFSAENLGGHHFQPKILALTHAMALGWGTMMILGASYQLVPVLVESKLQSVVLAKASFWLATLGIPMLVYGFYTFQLSWISHLGGAAIVAAVLCYVINLSWSVGKSGAESVQAVFVLTASLWLLLTTAWGLLLLLNFSMSIFPEDSLVYLSSHAHIGIIGWFLLLVIGVGSKLIPMFLISKYSQGTLLWLIYALTNSALILFLILELNPNLPVSQFASAAMMGTALLTFAFYCRKAYQQRIRRRLDPQMKISLMAIALLLLSLLVLMALIYYVEAGKEIDRLVFAYGFSVFFGWITAIILGMTFKTLPFIVWNRVYRHQSTRRKTPDPKSLFSHTLFKVMFILYGLGFAGVFAGILTASHFLIQGAAFLMILAALLYVWNLGMVALHKPENLNSHE